MKKNNCGFSLVEAVVAMAVILIVSASVLSLILSTSKAQERQLEHHRATTALADILTVYRVSESEDSFKENLAFALGIDGEIDLASVPLAKGYTAEISYGEAGLSVTVPEKPSMGYTFPEPVESESEEVMQ